MLELKIPEVELYDDRIGEFFTIRGQTIRLEHSLVSLAKWESRWEKPFLSKTPMTTKENVHYIKCMTITQNVHPIIFSHIAKYHLKEIFAYMELPMTATTFAKQKEPWKGVRKIVTAEVIYFWMTEFNIPFECQKWHLNRLLTLINVCNLERQPKGKMSAKALAKRNYALNEQRRKRLGTRG